MPLNFNLGEEKQVGRRAEACILLYYMASAVEFFTTKVGCSTFKALWSLSIGPALGMCLFTKISYQNKAPAGWVNKNHQLKPYSIAIYTLPHVWSGFRRVLLPKRNKTELRIGLFTFLSWGSSVVICFDLKFEDCSFSYAIRQKSFRVDSRKVGHKARWWLSHEKVRAWGCAEAGPRPPYVIL